MFVCASHIPRFLTSSRVAACCAHLPPQQEATLKAQGASDTLLQSFRVPSVIYSDTEAAAFEAQREQRKKAEQEAAAARAAAAPPDQPAKDDFRVMNVRFGQPVNLSQWGGPNNDVTFYGKKQFVGSDLVAAVLTDNTRTFTDSVTTTGANVNAYGAAAGTTTVQSSYSPTKVLTINRSSPVVVPGLPTLYPVYESGGVSLYFAHISTEAADSVKLAVKVSKK